MKIKDAAAISQFQISTSHGDLDYAHIIDEEIDGLDDTESPDEEVYTKGELGDAFNSINLSSFRPRKELNPRIWIDGTLNSRVRLRLLDIAQDFIDTLGVDWVKPKDVILTGSLANYNYSRYSDFDLHVVMDFSEVDERVNFVKEYFDSKKRLWNEAHENLKIYGYPVELYVQDSNEFHNASGIYSLYKNRWVTEPSRKSIEAIKLNKYYIKEKALGIMEKIDKLCDMAETETDNFKLEEIAKKAKALFSTIKSIRRESLKNGGEMSSGNIIFKCLRRSGHIGKLADLKAKTYDRLFSIQ
jgi:hypothetical protein